MKYVGSWSANNGSTYNFGYDSNNKRQLAKLMRNICKENVFAGNSGSWAVYEVNRKDDGPIITGIIKRR